MRFVGDRRELLVRVLLRAGRGAVRHHATRCGDLDHLCAVLDLIADGASHLGHTVGHAFLHAERHDLRGEPLEHRRLEVPAGRRDGVGCGHDARTVDEAGIDRSLQRDIKEVATGLHHQAEVAHRREPGEQRRATVHDSPECAVDGVVLDAVHRVGQPLGPTGSADEHVELHVHEARHERDVAEVDLVRRRRQLGRVHRRDAIPFHHDRGR